MKIVNLIHIGNEVRTLDDMTAEERAEIAVRLSKQAMRVLGYRQVSKEKKVTA